MSEELQRVWGPDGKANWFPKDMSDEEINSIMTKENDPHLDWADIGKGTLQGVRDLGEDVIAAPETIDRLGRAAIEWLRTVKPDAAGSNPVSDALTGYANKVGSFLDANQPKEPPVLPNSDDADWLVKQLIGPDYEPTSDMGKIGRFAGHYALPGIGGGRLAFGALSMLPKSLKFGVGAAGGAAAAQKLGGKAWDFMHGADYTGWSR